MADESTRAKFCRVCGFELVPHTTEYVIGLHVDCATRVEQRRKVVELPHYGWRRKSVVS